MESKSQPAAKTATSAPSTTPPKAPRAKARPRAAKSSKTTLAQAQEAAQINLQSHSASLDGITGFLSSKKNLGKLFTPSQIAAGMGNGIGDRDVRKTLQKAGLAKGKQPVIESGDRWLHLTKAGNRNQYAATAAGTPLAPAS